MISKYLRCSNLHVLKAINLYDEGFDDDDESVGEMNFEIVLLSGG